MMTTQTKQHHNIGCGDGPERWLFEDFQFKGDLWPTFWGRAVVGYDTGFISGKDDFGRLFHRVVIMNPVVLECSFDEEYEGGEEIRMNETMMVNMKCLILGAFSAVQCRVEEHELFLRGAIG